MPRYTVTVSVQIFADDKLEAKDKGLKHLYELMDEGVSSFLPIRLDAEVTED